MAVRKTVAMSAAGMPLPMTSAMTSRMPSSPTLSRIEEIAPHEPGALAHPAHAVALAGGELPRQERLLDGGGDLDLAQRPLLRLALFLEIVRRADDAHEIRHESDQAQLARGEVGIARLASTTTRQPSTVD